MDRFSYFWSLIVVGGTVFLVGAYKNVVLKVCYILWVNRKVREESAAAASAVRTTPFPRAATIVREAMLQNRIKQRSAFLWLRHLLICGGFTVLFLVDCIYTVFGHYLHHYVHYEYFTSGPGRALLKCAMELSGTVLFAGLTAGFIHRAMFASRERTLVDIKLIALLWAVTLTGFLTETFRLVASPDDPFIGSSFVAGPLARALRALEVPWRGLGSAMWVVHATITVAFFAFIPFSKFVHVIVAPLGRSITQDGTYAQMKRTRITEGLL